MGDLLWAWDWGGHGQLTSLALGYAVAQLVARGKRAVLEKLATFAEERTSRDRFAPYGITTYQDDEELAGSAARAALPAGSGLGPVAARVVRVLGDLPRRVQHEDLHAGNIPTVGEFLEKDSQTRHFMRSSQGTSPEAAFALSRTYIWEHAFRSWAAFSRIVAEPTVDPYKHYPSLIDGLDHLAKVLHTVEDSYAPGHVRRANATYQIRHVYYWDPSNKAANPAANWPGHSALDDPNNDLSAPYYQEARRTAGEVILAVLATSGGTQSEYVEVMGRLYHGKFLARWDGLGDKPISPNEL